MRELIHRNHEVVAFARNPKKIPEDVSSSPLIEVGLLDPSFKCTPKLIPISDNRGATR